MCQDKDLVILFRRVVKLRTDLEEQIHQLPEGMDDDDDLYESMQAEEDEAPKEPEGSMLSDAEVPEPAPEFLKRRTCPSSLETIDSPPGAITPASTKPSEIFEVPEEMTEEQKLELAAVLLKIQSLEMQRLPQSSLQKCIYCSMTAMVSLWGVINLS